MKKSLYEITEQKKAALEATIKYAEAEIGNLEKLQKYRKEKGIEKWLGNEFESSSQLTEEFALFAKEYKTELCKLLVGKYQLITFNRGHFYLSGFIKNLATDKIVYFSTSDVRGNEQWYTAILIRTAEYDKDYTGGINCFTDWPNLRDKIAELTQ